MANKRINKEKRALILALLCEGTAINAISRVTKTGKNQILNLILETGAACREWHEINVSDLDCEFIQADEIHSFVHTKQDHLPRERDNRGPEKGDCWTFTALCAETKFMISWETGSRTDAVTESLLSSMMDRIAGNFQLTTDKFPAYLRVMARIHNGRVDFGREKKIFDSHYDNNKKIFQGSKLIGREREVVIGSPDWDRISTSFVERHNLTIRQQLKRFARKTLGYSKKYENHKAAVDMFMFVYNFCRKSESHKIKGKTPAMAVGLADKPFSLERVVEIGEAYHQRVLTDKSAKEAAEKRSREDEEFEKAFALKFS